MALLTTLQKLEQVQAAISAIEGGAQSYTIGGRSVTKAMLATLYEREEKLQRQYDAEQGNHGTTFARFGAPG